MHVTKRFGLILATLGCSVTFAQLVEPRTVVERALVESVSKSMSTCFTALGPKRTFASVTSAPPQGELLAAVLMATSGPLVNDGYNYMLLLHGRSNSAFVVQLGGFAGSRTVYGPLSLNTQCGESPQQGASSPSSSATHGS